MDLRNWRHPLRDVKTALEIKDIPIDGMSNRYYFCLTIEILDRDLLRPF